MRNLVIMPAMAQNRERMNLGEYAEEATIIVDEPVRPAKHFIEANTQEATLHHLKHECITPVFSKDNELTINHAAFVETIQDATQSFFSGEKVEQADIRVSHIIKGRIPAPSTNLPTNCWNLTRPSIMREQLSALMFQPSMKQLEKTSSIFLS